MTKLNPFTIAKDSEELIETGASGEKFAGKFIKEAKEAETVASEVAEGLARSEGLNSIEELGGALAKVEGEAVEDLVNIKKGFKLDRIGKTVEEVADIEEEAVEDIGKLKKFSDSNLGKFSKYLGKKVLKYGIPISGVGYLLNEYALPEYDELKRDCQCTCQGFNKLNLNDEKWEQLNKILYCRGDGGASCDLQDGECPTGCTLNDNNKKSASLYGITNPSSFESNSPQYTDWKGITDNVLCPLNNDTEFKDDFKNYHIQRATEVAEAGTLGGASLGARFNSAGIAALGGAGTAAVAGEFIPSEFPGHCLYRLFDSARFKTDPDDATGEEEHQDLKVVKCQGGITEAGPDEQGIRKKCSLKAGEEGNIILDSGQAIYNNRDLGTCVAWNKGDGGKCISVTHAPQNVFYASLGEVRDDYKDIDCSVLNTEATCEESEYCYWENENNFDDIYMCLNDVTLIKMHNDILDGGGRQNLIKSASNVPVDEPKEKITNDTYKINSLNNYNSNKETDINDICNAYCNESLCNNPAIITMPAVPGVQQSVDGIKTIIKYVILFGLTLFIWKYIISEIFKPKLSGVHIQKGVFNINKISSRGLLMIMLIIVYLYADIISEKTKLDEFIDDQILPVIEGNL